MLAAVAFAVGGKFGLRLCQKQRVRVDRDSVTDPSPGWDHHTLARGYSPLSRALADVFPHKSLVNFVVLRPCAPLGLHPWRFNLDPLPFVFAVPIFWGEWTRPRNFGPW